MDPVLLSRIQFALTIAFHYIYPPLNIGLGVILVIMEGLYLKTGDLVYHRMAKFWVKIFGLCFAIGVATGIVMEFEFGTNWSNYSRFVGDVFGSALAAEGIFAFFLESGFLAILLFGWDRVSPKMHFFSAVMVALGAMFSAVWIVVANSWMQTPAGFHIVGVGTEARAEITGFWEMVFNASSMHRLAHVIMGCWQAGAWLVISVSAYYLLKGRETEFAKASMKIGLGVAMVAALGQLVSGHTSAIVVAEHQPAKLAAFEGHFEEDAPAALNFFGWVDEEGEKVRWAIGIPGMTSFLVHWDPAMPVPGLKAFPKTDWPPVNLTFQAYHVMMAIGMALIVLATLGLFLWWQGKLFVTRWFLWPCVFSVLLPQIANQFGWMAAEVGRQPWIVYGLMRTNEGISDVVNAGQILFSLIGFTLIYALLFILFIFLLDRKIKEGPGQSMQSSSVLGLGGPRA
ncbi:MAG: cytochrome ubiquinol oxidase subunit I [Candidatus Omnitrophota bacterium]